MTATEPLDVLLVQTPNVTGTFFNLPGKEIPLSLCSLAAFVARAGWRAAILDLDLEGETSPLLEKTLAAERPRLVGFSAYTPNVAIAARLARRAKAALPTVETVLGGFHASALPERTLREFPAFDLVVAGEGERTLTELLRRRREKDDVSTIAGVYARDGERVVAGPVRPLIADLGALPAPDRSLAPVHRYVPDPGNYFQLPSTGILYSRGCPHHCTFCSKSVFGARIRYRPIEGFLEEVEDCIGRFGIRDFRLEDEAPTINPARLRALCEGILQRGLRITWNCFSRVDSVDEWTLRLMRSAGCYHVTYGVESSLPDTLEKIGKPLDLERAAATVRLTQRLGIESKANFILGFPWETAADMRRVARWARRLSPDLVTFNLFKPLPGSRLYDELAAADKLRARGWEDYFTTSEAQVFDARYSEVEARQTLRRAVFSFYFRPAFAVSRLRRLLLHPRREIETLARGAAILLREAWSLLAGPRPVAASG